MLAGNADVAQPKCQWTRKNDRNLNLVKPVNQKLYVWNEEKNQHLKTERNITFEEVVSHIANGQVLDIVEHPNQIKYKGQRIFIVEINEYIWLVPFIETNDEVVLKTIIPSRKATKKYLRGDS